MAIEVRVNTDKLEAMLLRKSLAMKQSMEKVLREEGRLLAVALAKYTQPFSFGEDAHKKGMGAIERDYNRVYPALATQFILNKVGYKARPKDRQAAEARMASYVQAGNTEAIMKMLGDMKIANWSQTADPKFHRQRWDRGVLKSGPVQIVVDRDSVQKLMDQAKAISGFAKSGWAACARDLGGTRGIPGWVTRQKAPGRVKVDFRDNAVSSVTLINEVNYTSQVLSDSGMKKAIEERATKIQLAIDRAVKYAARHA